MPAPGQYRLAALPNLETLLARAAVLLTEAAGPAEPAPRRFTLPQDVYERLSDQPAAAEGLLRAAGVAADLARAAAETVARTRRVGRIVPPLRP